MPRELPRHGERHEERHREGGVPDGLLVGLLAFLIGVTLLVWTATGLAGLIARGAWPDGVAFTRTPVAIRALLSQPHDLAGAWPDTPAGQLSGYGLFWGLFIGELMVLVVLTVFVLGTLARLRAVRTARRTKPLMVTAPTVSVPEVQPLAQAESLAQAQVQEQTQIQEQPVPAPRAGTVPHERAEPGSALLSLDAPEPRNDVRRVLYGGPAARRPAAVQAVLDARGPVLVVTSDPTVWSETKDTRAKLGSVLVYDPGHLCDTPGRLHWSPTTGCEDADTAATRAAALLVPVRPPARIDAAMAETAETLLRCWLHAAAVDGRAFKQVHRWAQGNNAHEPVRILRAHPKAASGLAGLLESALTAYPERRELAQELTARALACMTSIHIREACTPNRADSLALESFVVEGGSLYVVGEPIEDPRTHPGAMPLLTAVTSSVVEHGRRMAARSSDGRLDPPLTLVLDDVAAVAPLPLLPELLATGAGQGMPAFALLRSREQGRAHWPAADRWLSGC
ncbi:TraM recognition domain-containing protein [Streptomyces sp. SCSIO 30461]|uniref:TraM recognition domain-containing protein n=1 Tax=Streptomyces sp. SCSIO 30461 TaxID=3118085 RepID=UPI0030D3DEB7